MIRRLLNLFRKEPPLKGPGQLIQIGGKLLDTSEWTPELIEVLKKEYLMPSCKDAYLIRVDLSASCTEGHVTTERVGVFSKKGNVSKKISDDLNKVRMYIPCKECGKLSKITGRRTVWQGDLGTWDGAT